MPSDKKKLPTPAGTPERKDAPSPDRAVKGPDGGPIGAKGETREQQVGRGEASRDDHGGKEGDSPQPEGHGNRQPKFDGEVRKGT